MTQAPHCGRCNRVAVRSELSSESGFSNLGCAEVVPKQQQLCSRLQSEQSLQSLQSQHC